MWLPGRLPSPDSGRLAGVRRLHPIRKVGVWKFGGLAQRQFLCAIHNKTDDSTTNCGLRNIAETRQFLCAIHSRSRLESHLMDDGGGKPICRPARPAR